jgi:hypothetical protein
VQSVGINKNQDTQDQKKKNTYETKTDIIVHSLKQKHMKNKKKKKE